MNFMFVCFIYVFSIVIQSSHYVIGFKLIKKFVYRANNQIYSSETDIIIKKVNLLADLWQAISFPPPFNNGNDGEVDFLLSRYGLSRRSVSGLIQHFQTCRDCAADGAFLMATQDENTNEDILRLSQVQFATLTDEESSDEDWGNFDHSLYLDKDEDEGLRSPEASVFPVEESDEAVLSDTKRWVQRVIADFSVCPFTVDANRAGIPLGGVRYSVSRAATPEEAFFEYWRETQLLLATPERELCTTLLVFPEVALFGNYELFEAFCDCLNDALTASSLGLETQVQLVFFHPKFQFRDGQARVGDDEQEGAANYARRSVWPMINLLRTQQVRAAQKGVATGIVYQQNEEHLRSVGTSTLQTMLYDRDWSQLPSYSSQLKKDNRAEIVCLFLACCFDLTNFLF
jgi:hypothetical protein